jgi:hypothetical protein
LGLGGGGAVQSCKGMRNQKGVDHCYMSIQFDRMKYNQVG